MKITKEREQEIYKSIQPWTVALLGMCFLIYLLFAVVMIITDRIEPNYEIEMPVSKPPEVEEL